MATEAARAPRSPRRRFVTPEGVDLGLTLAGVGERIAAFAVDLLAQVLALGAMTLLLGLVFVSGRGKDHAVALVWLLGWFVLRNGWFMLFEMGARAATPGKRLLKLRVVAQDGGRLTGGAVAVRNALREVELFLPVSFLFVPQDGPHDSLMAIAALGWSGILLLFPLFNRDRLRVGDLLAGTWVIEVPRAALGADLAEVAGARPRRTFPSAALDLYGVFELQTLEDVLRQTDDGAIAVVAGTIRRKAGLADDGDDRGFLQDYYLALCGRLERGVLLGRRRANKGDRAGR